jgi:hypothetical protein
MSFVDTLQKLVVQFLEEQIGKPAVQANPNPIISVADPPATRHLLLVEAKDNISREEISIAKFDRVDVIYVSRETLFQVSEKMKQFNIKWRSINMLFHGSANLEEESVCIFGIKMSMNRNIMMADPNVGGLINFTKAVCQYTDDSLYVYTCAVGVVDGLKELCLRLDKECNLKSGIFLSTNTTGNGAGQDWNIEWGTKFGFLTSGVHTNEIEHATVALFRDIKKLTFTLADEATDEQDKINADIQAEVEAKLLEIKKAEEEAKAAADKAKTEEDAKVAAEVDAEKIRVHGLKNVSDILLLSPEHISWLSARTIGQVIDAYSFSKLKKAQIAAFTPVQISNSWTRDQIHALTKEQIQALTKEQIQSLTGRQLSYLDKIVCLTKDQIGYLTPLQITYLTKKQIQNMAIEWLDETQIQALTQIQIRGLYEEHITKLTKANIQAFKPFQVRWFKSVQLSLFQTNQIPWFTQISYFTSILAFSETQMKAFTPTQIKLFSRNQQYDLYSNGYIEAKWYSSAKDDVAKFEKLVSLSSSKKTDFADRYYLMLRAQEYPNITWLLDDDVVPKLSIAYLGKTLGDVGNLGLLTKDQIQSLAKDQIQSLTKDQIQSLTKSQITDGLLMVQIGWFPKETFSAEQLSWMTLEQTNGIL